MFKVLKRRRRRRKALQPRIFYTAKLSLRIEEERFLSDTQKLTEFINIKLILFFSFLKYTFIYFNWRLITLKYFIGFAIHQHESAMGVHVFSIWTPPYPHHPSRSSQCTSPEYPVSCVEPGLAIHFTYDIAHVSMPFSQINPPSPSPTESKRLFYTSVSLLLSHIQGYHYHLSKFHIYVLVYCIGVFLSGLLHSV